MIQHCGRWCVQLYSISILLLPTSVGIDLKELGVRCRNVWNFAQRLKFKADFHSKMSVCRHELGGFNPPTLLTIPTLLPTNKNHRYPINFLRHDIAATCVLKMPLNPNHPTIHPSLSVQSVCDVHTVTYDHCTVLMHSHCCSWSYTNTVYCSEVSRLFLLFCCVNEVSFVCLCVGYI